MVDKPTRTKAVSIRLTEEEFKELVDYSNREGSTMPSVVARMLVLKSLRSSHVNIVDNSN